MNNDEYMENLEKKVASLERRCEAQEQEFFTLLDILKDINWMNSHGKTKEIADEIESILTKYIE